MLSSYLKIALKVFLRRKFFSFISLFGVSFTLLVLMVAAAFFDHVFGPLPPETKIDRSLGVYLVSMRGEHTRRTGLPGYGFLDRYVRTLPDPEKVSVHSAPQTVTSYKDGVRITSFLKRTDGEFWQILEFKFLEGAPFTPEDEKNANFVAVINEATRRKFFGGATAVGKMIEADGQRFRVVGVVPNVPIFRIVPFADIYVPISTSKSDSYKQELVGNFMATILARDRSDLQAIRREFRARVARVELPDRKNFDRFVGEAETIFDSFGRELFGEEEPGRTSAGLLTVILALMVLFMVLPTVNLVNINVSRIMERAPEIGVRKAFGASRLALVGQFVVENVVLSLIGGAVGFVLSFLVLRTITASGLIPYAEFHVNIRIFLYGLAIATFFGLFSGVWPAWKMSRLHPVEALQGRSR